MVWKVMLHPEVESDLRTLGKANAQKIVKVLEGRVALGEPDKLGKPLSREPAGCRRIRTGHLRIVYKADGSKIQVFVIAAGLWRHDEIFNLAVSRSQKMSALAKLANLKCHTLLDILSKVRKH